MISRASRIVAALIVLGACSGAPTREDQAPPPCPECNVPSEIETETTYRVVERAETKDPVRVQGPPFEPFDPGVVDVVVETGALDDVGVEGAVAAFRGNFARSRGEEVVVVDDKGELTFFASNGSVIARQKLGVVESEPSPRAVKLVDDRLDIAVVHRAAVDEPPQFSVFRVIGGAAAEVFRADLTDATVEFVHRGDERGIRVTHASGHSEVFRWNKWEGVWRVPKPPPTAPR